LPEVHCAPAVHAAPLARWATQRPPSQVFPVAQSAAVVHEVAHTAPLHAYAPHIVGVAAGQAPMPSQVAAVTAAPIAQPAMRHAVVVSGYVHAIGLVPLQVPVHASPAPPVQAVRVPCGAPVFAWHRPSAPETSQASH
jgi:hypothetical protein